MKLMQTLILGISAIGFVGMADMSTAEARRGNGWHGESAYLRCNPDVRRAVRRGDFRSGWHHYQQHGRYENRITDGNCNGRGGRDRDWDNRDRYDRIPRWFDERGYLECNPDVRRAVYRGDFRSGYHHYQLHGRYENRQTSCHGNGGGGHIPSWFDEEGYLRCNDDVRRAVYRGDFRSGYHHYQLHGQYENRRFDCRDW